MDTKQTNNLSKITQDYVNIMTNGISGMKALIFDKDTKIMFSLIQSKSNAIKEEIFMFEDIEKLNPEEKHYNLKGIFFLRPTDDNALLLKNIFKNPIFVESYLNFTNNLTDDYLKQVASSDVSSQVKNVNEIYFDYYVLNSNLFHLNFDIENSIALSYKQVSQWRNLEHIALQRVVDGIASACLSMRLNPIIKYTRGNDLNSMIARKLIEFFNENSDMVNRSCGRDNNGILLLIDRKEDPITPLLTQWTYQAMIHELIGISQNIVKVKSESLVISDFEDSFFKENLNSNFGDVATKIKLKVEEFSKENKSIENVNSIEDMKKLVENLPEKKKHSNEITKHTNIVYELNELMDKYKLLDISSLEQDIATKDEKKTQFKEICNIISSKDFKNPLEKIKLFLLFIIRYEQDNNSISTLKQLFSDNNLKDYIDYYDSLISYAGQTKRMFDLLGNKDFLSKHLNKFSAAFKEIPNVFTQHTSLLNTILKKVIKKEKINELETLNPSKNEKNEKYKKILVFMTGGVTYEEARDVKELNRTLMNNNGSIGINNNNDDDSNNNSIVLGGTHMVNSKSFLDSLNEIRKINSSNSINNNKY